MVATGAQAEGSQASAARPLTFLVADDVEAIRGLMQMWLESCGHRVFAAASGSEASKLLSHATVDAVVCDVVMPDGDGIEFTLELKKRHPEVPVLAISGGGAYLGSGHCLTLAKGVGADAGLMKPFGRDKFLAAVNGLLTTRR